MSVGTRLKKHWKGLTVTAVAAAVALGVGVPYAYIHFVQGEAPAPLALRADVAASAPTVPIDGTWRVAAGSQAGYRVHEMLAGQSTTAVGRTSQVSGSIVVAGNTVSAGSVTVDLDSVASDETRRDNKFRTGIMDTAEYPTATFTMTSPATLPSIPGAGQVISVPVTGDLTVHGVTRPVTVTLNASRSGSALNVQGSITVAFADYGVQAPNAGLAVVDPSGQIEFLLDLTHS
jgi:polyisoprenoid-binding protein YceI